MIATPPQIGGGQQRRKGGEHPPPTKNIFVKNPLVGSIFFARKVLDDNGKLTLRTVVKPSSEIATRDTGHMHFPFWISRLRQGHAALVDVNTGTSQGPWQEVRPCHCAT